MMRYYTRLESFEPNISHSVTLTEVADKLFTSLRHARTLLGKMHQAEWVVWEPKVGRNQRSNLTLRFSNPELAQHVASKLIEQGKYEKALSILPWAALIKVSLAKIQLESSHSTSRARLARQNLEDALRYEPEMASAWRFLATAEGRLGNAGAAALALAEEALLRGKNRRALELAKRAMKKLAEGSPSWFRAQDIANAAGKPE